MNTILLTAFLFVTLSASAQKKVSTISLAPKIRLTAVVKPFNASKHRYDTCQVENNGKYICLIDNKQWYGGARGMELPKNQLARLELIVSRHVYPLNVSGMYNPALGGELKSDQFRFVRYSNYSMLYAHFSDGEGSYTVYWKIVNGISERIKISTEDQDFQWQTE